MKYDESIDEREIINKIKTNQMAFDYIYDKYFPQIFQYVMYRVYNREVAEDITSVVFFKAMKNIKLFEWFNKIPFSAWLYRIAYNEICNNAKKDKKQEKILKAYKNEDADTYYEMNTEDNERSFEFIHDYLKKLPQRDQEIITLRFFEKKAFAEIAQITGKNESTLRVNLHRALKKLESLMPSEVLNHAYRQISM